MVATFIQPNNCDNNRCLFRLLGGWRWMSVLNSNLSSKPSGSRTPAWTLLPRNDPVASAFPEQLQEMIEIYEGMRVSEDAGHTGRWCAGVEIIDFLDGGDCRRLLKRLDGIYKRQARIGDAMRFWHGSPPSEDQERATSSLHRLRRRLKRGLVRNTLLDLIIFSYKTWKTQYKSWMDLFDVAEDQRTIQRLLDLFSTVEIETTLMVNLIGFLADLRSESIETRIMRHLEAEPEEE
ncbi:hypothetical protein BJ508DRAFT_34928 [Ascobolus immersus RN42]|uniref:Uncharacterized protein n=1 Tax=Ascobolus immersus RN42 TaxID=1160509 RepID=A0A3N4HXQ4_ASCIM|nr:hypothetical protein BJ508DRAFT_34928 [Ascobolus immersus RN42]